MEDGFTSANLLKEKRGEVAARFLDVHLTIFITRVTLIPPCDTLWMSPVFSQLAVPNFKNATLSKHWDPWASTEVGFSLTHDFVWLWHGNKKGCFPMFSMKIDSLLHFYLFLGHVKNVHQFIHFHQIPQLSYFIGKDEVFHNLLFIL